MMFKRLLPLFPLALLGACDLFTPDPGNAPVTVSSVTPQSGATGVSAETTVEALLNLQGNQLNLLTLTDASVALTGPEGAVAATRTASGNTLVLEPSEALAGDTSYTFTVTDALQTESGESVSPFTSTFVTGAATDPTDPTDPTVPTDPTDPAPPTDPTDPGDGISGLVMVNASSEPSSGRMVLTRIGDTTNPCEGNDDPECNNNRWNNLTTTDTGEVVLRNTGSSSLSLTLSTSAPDIYTITPSSLTLAPGSSDTAEVVFTGTYSAKGVYDAFIDAEVNGQRASIELAGVYMTRPEAGNEPSLSQILRAAGLQTTLGEFRTNVAGSPPAGTEVRSRLWQKADPGEDVVITELAAFKTCCFNYELNTTDFELFEPDAIDGSDYFFQLQYDQDYAQTMYPAGTDGDSPNQGTTDFAGPFRIQVDRYSTKDLDQPGLIGVRVWPVTGRANAYIVGQDYALAECGTTAEDSPNGLTANCDYQDHVYLVENIAPFTE